MKTPFQYVIIAAVFASALALVACGKSDNKNPPPPPAAGAAIYDPNTVGPLQPGIQFGLYAQNTLMNQYFH